MRHPDLDAEDDDAPFSLDEPSRDAHTPRGGFMARPGLKAPPRHAVVIRGGDIEPSETIPLARASQPPPPPAPSEPAPESSSDEVTLRAMPTPPPARVAKRPATPGESVAPPSDMPVVSSVPPPQSSRALTERRARSRWPIVAAAAAGLLLGLASIAVTRLQDETQGSSAAGPARDLPPPARSDPVQATGPVESSLAPPPSALPSAATGAPDHTPDAPLAPAGRGKDPGSKRSIF